MASYLTTMEAASRLLSFGIQHVPSQGSLNIASDILDDQGPFVGIPYSTDLTLQTRAFPRSITLNGDTENEVPERVKDWVALKAYSLDMDEDPPISHISVQHLGSKTFTRPRVPRAVMLRRGLLRPYQRVTGVAS